MIKNTFMHLYILLIFISTTVQTVSTTVHIGCKEALTSLETDIMLVNCNKKNTVCRFKCKGKYKYATPRADPDNDLLQFGFIKCDKTTAEWEQPSCEEPSKKLNFTSKIYLLFYSKYQTYKYHIKVNLKKNKNIYIINLNLY